MFVMCLFFTALQLSLVNLARAESVNTFGKFTENINEGTVEQDTKSDQSEENVFWEQAVLQGLDSSFLAKIEKVKKFRGKIFTNWLKTVKAKGGFLFKLWKKKHLKPVEPGVLYKEIITNKVKRDTHSDKVKRLKRSQGQMLQGWLKVVEKKGDFLFKLWRQKHLQPVEPGVLYKEIITRKVKRDTHSDSPGEDSGSSIALKDSHKRADLRPEALEGPLRNYRIQRLNSFILKDLVESSRELQGTKPTQEASKPEIDDNSPNTVSKKDSNRVKRELYTHSHSLSSDSGSSDDP
eukprot:GFUD01111795.1.p1 GENE.GFUD01111795.1~~GFUD01111795.1.p1  ORF type:complete len:293 (-),score=67.37 GFUD01111795.1:160-1038(-)